MGKPRVVDAMQNAGYRVTDQPGVYRRDDGADCVQFWPRAGIVKKPSQQRAGQRAKEHPQEKRGPTMERPCGALTLTAHRRRIGRKKMT